MSWQATSWAGTQKVGHAGRKLLLLIIANYANEHGITFVSVARLAQEAECHANTITNNIKILEEMGLLRVERKVERDGGGRVLRRQNVYHLRMMTGTQHLCPGQNDHEDININNNINYDHNHSDCLGTIGTISFPENGRISFGKMGEIARDKLPFPPPDLDRVGAAFVRFCRAHAIDLGDRLIEKKFATFCSKWR